MCGIVGLLCRTEEMRAALGAYAVPMLECMGDRGPDSAGLAVFASEPDSSRRRFSLFAAAADMPWDLLGKHFAGLDKTSELTAVNRHALLSTAATPAEVHAWLGDECPGVRVLATGRSITLYKDEGHPREICDRYRLETLRGSHCVGHTRMATESAVSPAHSHPYTAGEDFCLVHNGSLSNPYSLRRILEKRGIGFETDNDTEAACRYIEWRMREGDTLEQALEKAFAELDGFYTLLMATADKMVLVRDAFACKPAVVAEADDYVAVASEFRTLAHLPGIQDARIYEPAPEEIYSWSR